MNNSPLPAVSQAQSAITEASSQALPLAPIHLPAEPGAWPLAWGWWAIAAFAIFIVLTTFIMMKRYKKRRLPKKTALRLLAQNSSQVQGQKKVANANDMLRQVCLSYYPRPVLASLHGQRWYQFLDEQHPSVQTSFQANQNEWQAALYQKDPISEDTADKLYQQVEDWINQALPPSKKKLKAVQQTFKQSSQDLSDGVISSARPVSKAPKALIEKERILTELEAKNQQSLERGSKDDV